MSYNAAPTLRAAVLASAVASVAAAAATTPTYSFLGWSEVLKRGTCSRSSTPKQIPIPQADPLLPKGELSCALVGGVKTYAFPAGVYEINEQLLVPENTTIIGAADPNDMQNPTQSPDWSQQTLFLATRGATSFTAAYCYADNMVTTRVGFVLSSNTVVRNVAYQGIDVIRPNDNAALCGGGAFETKGCAENSCGGKVNNGGSDGLASQNVLLENIRVNDYYYQADESKIGAFIPGNTNCTPPHEIVAVSKHDERFATNRSSPSLTITTDNNNSTHHHQPQQQPGGDVECCFCQPNNVRSSQVAVWVPMTRKANVSWTENLVIRNLVSRTTQADGINLHANVRNAVVENVYISQTGDDGFALWGAKSNPYNVTFRNCEMHNPGIIKPNWYGNCFATYGLDKVLFEDVTCRAPTLANPIHMVYFQYHVMIDTSMFVFFTTFGAAYKAFNNITIKGYTFTDLEGTPYGSNNGSRIGWPLPGKMAWTFNERRTPTASLALSNETTHVGSVLASDKSREKKKGVYAPYYFFEPPHAIINVYVAKDNPGSE